MPTDANGTYTLPPSYFVQNGDPIQPVQHNPPFEDLQQGMTDRLMRNGAGAMTGDLNMGAHKVVGLVDGTGPGDAATVLQVQMATPSGAVMAFARSAAPNGWLPCVGQEVSRTTYAGLFAAIGTAFGAGDGSTTFNLPDLRGYFVRGWNHAATGLDVGRAFGSTQVDALKSHNHGGATSSAGAHIHSTDNQGSHTHTGATDVQGVHSHTGSTSTDGNHVHSIQWGDGGNSHPLSMEGQTGGVDGTFNTDPNGSHAHALNINAAGSHAHNVSTNAAGAHTHTTNSAGAHSHLIASDGGAEVRPYNIALLYCIKL